MENIPSSGNKGSWFELRTFHIHADLQLHKDSVKIKAQKRQEAQERAELQQHVLTTATTPSAEHGRTVGRTTVRTVTARTTRPPGEHEDALVLKGRDIDQAVAHFKVVVGFIGRHGHPVSDASHLFSLCHEVRSMDVATNLFKQTRHEASNIIMFMAKCLDEQIRQEISASSYLSFSADGSTDRTTSHHLIVYVYYLHRGRLCCAYLDVVDCGGSAVNITNAVLKVLGPKLSSKLVGGSCDGASVMLGSTTGGGKNNVRALLQQRFPWLILIHCTAHRQALVNEHAAKVPFVADLCDGVQALATLMSFSYLKRQIFLEWACLTDEAQLKHARIHKIRWLSRGQAFENLTRTMLTNLVMLQDMQSKEAAIQQKRAARRAQARARAQGSGSRYVDEEEDQDKEEKVKALMRCAELVLTTNFFFGVPLVNAILNKMNRFNKVFQSPKTPATHIKTMLDTIISELTSEYLSNSDVLSFKTMTKSKDGKVILNKTIREIVEDEQRPVVFLRDHAKIVVREETDLTEEVALTLHYESKGTSPAASKQKCLTALQEGVQRYVRQIVHCMEVSFPQDVMTYWKHMHNIQVDRIRAEESFGIEAVTFFAAHFSGEHMVTKHCLIDGIHNGDTLMVGKERINSTEQWDIGGRAVQDWKAKVLDVEYETEDPTTANKLTVQFEIHQDSGVGGEVITFIPGTDRSVTNVSKIQVTGPINAFQLLQEWFDFCQLVCTLHDTPEYKCPSGGAEPLLHTIIDRDGPCCAYPECQTLFELISVFPSNATACEVGFSACNKLKSAKQSDMGIAQLAAKMRTYMAFHEYGYHKKVLTVNTNYEPYCQRYHAETKDQRSTFFSRQQWRTSFQQPQDKLPLARKLGRAKRSINSLTSENKALKRKCEELEARSLVQDEQVTCLKTQVRALRHYRPTNERRARQRVATSMPETSVEQPSVAQIFVRRTTTPNADEQDDEEDSKHGDEEDSAHSDDSEDNKEEDCEDSQNEEDNEDIQNEEDNEDSQNEEDKEESHDEVDSEERQQSTMHEDSYEDSCEQQRSHNEYNDYDGEEHDEDDEAGEDGWSVEDDRRDSVESVVS